MCQQWSYVFLALTHRYDVIILNQHCFRQWLVSWHHQGITWNKYVFLSIKPIGTQIYKILIDVQIFSIKNALENVVCQILGNFVQAATFRVTSNRIINQKPTCSSYCLQALVRMIGFDMFSTNRYKRFIWLGRVCIICDMTNEIVSNFYSFCLFFYIN